MKAKRMYVIWEISGKDYIRDRNSGVLPPGQQPIMLFVNKRTACRYAAQYWGYEPYQYSQCKRDGWCEVKPVCLYL